MDGGVALRFDAKIIEIRPYLLRQVCTNGAIMIQSVWATTLPRTECTVDLLQESLAKAGTAEAFEIAIADIRRMPQGGVDMAMSMMSLFPRLSEYLDSAALLDLLERFANGGDLSGYGLMNAVTSVARDTKDHERRWRLEELGASVPAILSTAPDMRSPGNALEMPVSTELTPV
jgi:hypothetical protein